MSRAAANAGDRGGARGLSLATVLVTGLVLAAGACATAAPGAAGTPSGTTAADDPWPGRYRYTSTSVTQGGHDRALVGAAFIEVSLLEVGRVSVYAGCNTLSMPVRLTGGRMLVDVVSATKKGCPADQLAQDDWLRQLFEGDPSVRRNGLDLVLAGGDTQITLRADLSPS